MGMQEYRPFVLPADVSMAGLGEGSFSSCICGHTVFEAPMAADNDVLKKTPDLQYLHNNEINAP
jgi:hypothetical protein